MAGETPPFARGMGVLLARMNRREARTHVRLGPRPDPHWLVRNESLLDAISDDDLRQLGSSGRVLRCPRRRPLLLDSEDGVYLMTSGAAKLCRIGRLGRRIVEGVVAPGDLFGRISTRRAGEPIDGYELEALEDADVLCVPRSALRRLLERRPELSLTVIQIVEERERVLRRRLEDLAFKDVTTRVAEALVDLARDYGEACPHGMAVDVRITQQDVADLVGASRQMVNRVIRRLTLSLYLVRKGKHLCILHHERLRRLAGSA